MSVIDLNEFNMKNLFQNSSILIIGKRRSGKSWLLRDIFYNKKDIPSGIVFSGSEHVAPFFSKFIPDIYIYKDFDPRIMENAFINQKNKLRKYQKNEKYLDDEGKCLDNSFFVVLDDMLAEGKKWKNDETIKTLFLNGRHYNIFNCVTLQYLKGVPPDIRQNIDYVFIFNEPSIERRKIIYNEYCSCIPTFKIFCDIMDNICSDYGCLVVQQTGGKSNKIEELVFWYKAEPRENFKVGSKNYWHYHNKQYNDTHGLERDKINEEIMKRERDTNKKIKVFVNKQGKISKVK